MIKKDTRTLSTPPSHPELKGLLLLFFTFLSLLSLLSYNSFETTPNWLGLIGHHYAWLLLYLFGLTAYPFLAFMGWMGWSLLIYSEIPSLKSKAIYLLLFMISLGVLFSLYADIALPLPGALKHKILSENLRFNFPYPHYALRNYLGGVPLYYLYRDIPLYNLYHLLGNLGVAITFFLLAFLSFVFLLEINLVKLLKPKPSLQEEVPSFEVEPIDIPYKHITPVYTPPPQEKPEKALSYEPKIRTAAEREEKKSVKPFKPSSSGRYTLPPPSLLTNAKKIDQPSLKKELKRQAEILEETLHSFGIEAKVGDINCGPTISSFEIHPAVGVKVQKITALENDIALKLQAKSIRIIAPIPGKAAVGVEIPSPYPQEVSFKEMLISYQQGSKKLHIPVILGKTVTGENVVSDLAKMPHCLIAGATGSGKSVCINTIIMSIVMNASPDEVKLIMIDPKKVELTPYTNLPHLIAPVITEPHGAYAALNWMVKEMQNRYEILKQLGVRNITAFNSRKINLEFEASLSLSIPEKMFAIVGIIDEFADLMMASSSDLETPIARIAQMARAVGIHLILATQRPSREVITGLIKANFPTRIAFKVASRINSQIILDDTGAETLLGNGDMLFLAPGTSQLLRSQGAYLSDDDISKVLEYLYGQASPQYLIPSFDTMSSHLGGDDMDDEPQDELYEEAKQIVIHTQKASTTYLQRKFKIGYSRAASLIDALELHGVVSTQEGNKERQVLIKNDKDE
ncbi:DNA translocase FtsK 4TM domain-containing protein [Rhabdochlamydiaceae symbiont of Dictyostelium giganteum]|uniref:FtsK/SpoIIIE family DNA translocase n=1 Tax=Rhabdochlamydiaceae symbiont of Dictyostelium giganteum TaxID=3342349 RepID=UPI0038500E3B